MQYARFIFVITSIRGTWIWNAVTIVQMLMIFYWSLVGESEIKKAAATVKALVRRQKPKNFKNIKDEVLEKLQELSMKIKSCGGKLTANRLRRFSKICLRV